MDAGKASGLLPLAAFVKGRAMAQHSVVVQVVRLEQIAAGERRGGWVAVAGG